MVEDYRSLQNAEGGPPISIAPPAMREIEAHALRGFHPPPDRGAEIGGVLLGSVDPKTGGIAIDSFEPVQIEYSFGPSYILSDADYARWDGWIYALHAASPRIVGFCRSDTRGDPRLLPTPEDRDLMHRFLPSNQGVFLLIQPLADGECRAAAFPLTETKPPLLGRRAAVAAILTGVAAAAAIHYMSERSAENPLSRMRYPINSSSDTGQAKPYSPAPASAGTGRAR